MFGELFRVLTFGESHGPALGCVVEGCPAGLALSVDDVAMELRRRRPVQGGASTSRNEPDEPEILSGVFEGITLGTPIAIVVRNTGQCSSDYDALRNVYRPGHADCTWQAKYGLRDHRGGGRSSGRETVGRVAAGAVAKVFLASLGVSVQAWTASIAGVEMPGPGSPDFDLKAAEQNPLRIPCIEAAEQALARIGAIRAEGDSAGGVIACLSKGVPAGIGEPVFDKLDARLAAAMLSIGAVKGIEFGAGFAAAAMRGSQHNDIPLGSGQYRTNNAGGILGGISSGQDLVFRVAVKPTASIARSQPAIDRNGNIRDMVIGGRHDVCIVPRAVPVVEAMTALALADFALLNRAARF